MSEPIHGNPTGRSPKVEGIARQHRLDVAKLNGLVGQQQAHRLDNELRSHARSIANSMISFKALIATCKAERIHEPLGFKLWPAYIADVIKNEMGQLPAADRKQIVALLDGEHMSGRMIAEAVGVSETQVRRDKKDQLRHNVAPETDSEPTLPDVPAISWGRDGKPYRANRKPDAPRPKPSPDRFSQKFSHALKQIQNGAMELRDLCSKPEFDTHRDYLIRHQRENIVWAQDLLTKLLPLFGDRDVRCELVRRGDVETDDEIF